MNPVLDDDITRDDQPKAAKPSRPLTHADLPDLDETPKWRLHPMVAGALGFVAAAGGFYGMEALAPVVAKPSTIIGGYAHEIAAASKAGELKAQLRYDTAFRNMDLNYQDQVKAIETAAVQWQEKNRVILGNYAEDYRSAWNRANIYAQATVDLQKMYASQRYQITHETVGGEIMGANTATMIGLLGGLFSPEFGESALDYADTMRDRALSKLDDAAKSGVTVSVEGWNEGLPDPDAVAAKVANLPPLTLPAYRPRAITSADAKR